MKILIVGSKGFIGSHCVEFFSQNHEVWQCDIILDYNTPNYFIIEQNLNNFNEIFKNNEFDLCINCSGAANVQYSINNPMVDFELNTYNIIRILEAIRTNNSKCKLLTMSSAAVYGNPKTLPITPDASVHPLSPYGYHKMMAEQICEEYYKFWNIPNCNVRIFSTYGPGLKKQLLWDIFRKLINNDTIELYGTGNETRDFIYIDDLMNALDIIVKNSIFDSSSINVANGCQISVAKIAANIESLFNGRKTIKFNGITREGDPLNWEADISQITKWGYSPKIDIITGIKQYHQWFINENILG